MSRCIPDNKRKTSCVVLLRKINWDNFRKLHRLIVLDKKKKKEHQEENRWKQILILFLFIMGNLWQKH